MDQAISDVLENYVTSTGKYCCHFVGASMEKRSNHENPPVHLTNSQPNGQPPGQLPEFLDGNLSSPVIT